MKKTSSFFIDAKTKSLRDDRAADQRLCFRFIKAQSPYFANSEISILTILSGCTSRFVSDLVGNPVQMSYIARKHSPSEVSARSNQTLATRLNTIRSGGCREAWLSFRYTLVEHRIRRVRVKILTG